MVSDPVLKRILETTNLKNADSSNESERFSSSSKKKVEVVENVNNNTEKYCVYAHVLRSDGRLYIGMSAQHSVFSRWGNDGEGYSMTQPIFHDAIKQYGWNAFDHQILCYDLPYNTAAKIEKDLIITQKTTDINYGFNGIPETNQSTLANTNVKVPYGHYYCTVSNVIMSEERTTRTGKTYRRIGLVLHILYGVYAGNYIYDDTYVYNDKPRTYCNQMRNKYQRYCIIVGNDPTEILTDFTHTVYNNVMEKTYKFVYEINLIEDPKNYKDGYRIIVLNAIPIHDISISNALRTNVLTKEILKQLCRAKMDCEV